MIVQPKNLLAGVLACSLTVMAWVTRPLTAEQGHSNGRFAFSHYSLAYGSAPAKRVRTVHKSYRNIESWISSVGAAVALNDIDGDGLPNDVCLVDPRADTVTVGPVPGGQPRFRPFTLTAPGEPASPTAPMGCLPGDFDEDGRMDLLVYYWGRTPVLFLNRNVAGETLTSHSFVAQEVVPGGGRWYSNSALIADLNGDGHPDLVIGNYFPDNAKVLDANDDEPQHLHSSMSHAFNGGGKHFLLRAPNAVSFRDVVPQLVNADGQEVSADEAAQILHGWTLALGAADLNGDLLPELYIANDFGPDRLLQNRSTPDRLRFHLLSGRRTLSTPKSKVLGHDSFKGMGVDFSDIAENGRMAILVSNITDEFALEESNFVFVNTCGSLTDSAGYACYTDRSEQLGLSRSGWGWDIKSGDFDNSGMPQLVQANGFLQPGPAGAGINRWPQLHETAMGNDVFLQFPSAWHNYQPGDGLSNNDHNRFFVRQPDGRYLDLSNSLGMKHDAPARGIAVADVDGDGRLDFAIANQWGDSDFYHNDSPTGSYLSLRLLLPAREGVPFAVASDRPATGSTYAMTASVTATLPDGHITVEQVNGGNGHSGKNAFNLHFGLGAYVEGSPIPLEVRWRDRHGHVCARKFSVPSGKYNVILGV